MKNQFILFQRAGTFYCEDTTTGKQSSLRTKDKIEALRLLNAKNEAVRQPAMNMQLAQRDENGQIRGKRGDTRVGTLRQEYGEGFAKGYRSDTKLQTVREDMGKSLSELIKKQ